ncbi:uncharacterized protein LOC110838906 [Zootermopsis nevadensis]|uniref:uncharacterized protein LOC110838906 n=1 Tax=Zootermopsis nevadensis TaxID=136037 RepID=UPI000B8E28AF|nr:uncharacterized protein LOC110838906 [Zootermopsis nevadensis]
MVKLTTVISGLLTIIVFTVFSVAFAATLGQPDESYYHVLRDTEERLGSVIRHGRSRSHFLRYGRRSGSNPIFESYDILNNDENKNSIMKSSAIDDDPTIKIHYESTTVADELEGLDLTSSSSSLGTTVPIKQETKYSVLPTFPQSTTSFLYVITQSTKGNVLKTTATSAPVKEEKSASSVNIFSLGANSSDLSQNVENRLRSTADFTSPRREHYFEGDENNNHEHNNNGSPTNPKDELGALYYDEEDLGLGTEGIDSDIGVVDDLGRVSDTADPKRGMVDVVTRFLTIVESQHLLGENCTAGTDLNLGEGVVDQYAQERFRVEADVAVNRANMLTRLWKYADTEVMSSEYLLHASVFSMVEFDEDIFAAGNCYDQFQYKDYWLFCPYAYRLPEGPILVKDLAVEYKYLSNTSEWFYIARKHAENVIRNYSQFSRGYNTYTYNETAHTERVADEILSVRYEDGKWSKPYYDCGGGNIWMLTYTVPFFGFHNDTYFFKGTSGIDIDLRRVDIDQCPLPPDSTQLNIFAASDKCKKRTTQCVPIPGLGFRRGSYKCVCRRGFYFPDVRAVHRYYNGTVLEEEYEKLLMEVDNQYSEAGMFECLQCAEGCESCEDDRPCVVSLNWVMRTAILVLSCVIICCLPVVVLFTWRYGSVKVVRAASPVLLRVITLGAFFIYCTVIVMYPRPNIYTCTVRVWLREIGFSLTYGALMLKTWRISVIFRVRSAKAVKITDLDLLKRLGVIVTIFSVFLVIRTLVAPPLVIVGRTADDLKAFLCRTDWWDHSFTTLEVMFLVWGIRLCIVVRKAPSEFNESRFISMAIYNEFLLSVFLNVSMLFLQKPANPDLLYIIFFCHTQLTVTLLLCLIFGSKAYMVFKGHGKSEESSSAIPKPQAAKFLSKPRSGNSQCAISTNSSTNTPD